MLMGLFWQKKITKEERDQDFYWIEGCPYVANAKPWQFWDCPLPRSMNQVKKETWPSILEITQVKRKHGLYPIQKWLSKILWSQKNTNA